MVVGRTLHAIKHGTLKCQIEHCNPCRRPTDKFEERKKYRQQILNVWLNSVSDDLDLITDWWFFYRMFDLHGVDISSEGGLYAHATLALFVCCILGSISYLLELYQSVFKYPDTIRWLATFTIFCEDVPQIILSVFLSGALGTDLTPLAAFNISTSVYSALIKVSGEMFVNYCYCCKFTPPEDEDEDEV